MVANLNLVDQGDVTAEHEVDHPGSRRIGMIVLLLIGAALTLFLLVWGDGSQRRALRDMPEPQRKALLSRTLENLRSVCKSPEDAMRDFCSEQARFALDFPDCDDACKGLAAAQLSRLQPPR